MSVRISLTLEASEMFLSLHMIFSLERAAVVRVILERIPGFDPSLQMIVPRYLKFSTSSSLWSFNWSLFGSHLGCLSSLLSCLDLSPFCTLWRLFQDASFFLNFCIYDNVICKAEVGNKSSPDAHTTFMVIQCLTHDSVWEDIKEGWWE